MVQFVIKVLVDLARGTVLDEETAENTHAAHPKNLAGHTGIGSTLSLTVATVSAFSSSKIQLAGTAPGVHGNRLSDDEAIGYQLSDGLTRVGACYLGLLVGVQPDLALAAADDRRGKALLSSQVDPIETVTLACGSAERKDVQRYIGPGPRAFPNTSTTERRFCIFLSSLLCFLRFRF